MELESYLTYDEYAEMGGKVDSSAFPNLERRAKRKIDCFTHDRLKLSNNIPKVVKELSKEYVDRINGFEQSRNIESYSNGQESISYAQVSISQFDVDLYRLAVEMLPIELISGVVE